MADQQHNKESRAGVKKEPRAEGNDPPTQAQSPTADPVASSSMDPEKLKKLTAEEQMALYEKDLKENDWGHQPC